MITKMNKNVLLVQDIPSNLIEEVILILKTEDKKIKTKTREILMVEANEIIKDCSIKLQDELENKKRKEREEETRKKRKKANLLALASFLLFTTAIVFCVKWLM